ncbi:MAG: hypothetical protein R3C01_07280 [Planctomycetaceae bacterium]
MNCREFSACLQQPQGERRSPLPPSVAVHLETCTNDSCRRLWEEHLRFERAIEAWKGSVPQVSLTGRVLEQLSASTGEISSFDTVRPLSPSSSSGTTHRHSARLPLGMSRGARTVLAIVMFSIGLGWGFWQNGGNPVGPAVVNVEERNPAIPENDPANSNMPSDNTVPPPNDVEPIEVLVAAPVGESYARAAQSATEFVTDAAFLLVAGDDDGSIDEPNRASQWVEGIGEKLEPVRQDLSRTLTSWLAPQAAM